MNELRHLHELAAIKVCEAGQQLTLRIPAGLVDVRNFRSLGGTHDALALQVFENLSPGTRRHVDAGRQEVSSPLRRGVLPYQQQSLEVRHRVQMIDDELNELLFVVWVVPVHAVTRTRWFFS